MSLGGFDLGFTLPDVGLEDGSRVVDLGVC